MLPTLKMEGGAGSRGRQAAPQASGGDAALPTPDNCRTMLCLVGGYRPGASAPASRGPAAPGRASNLTEPRTTAQNKQLKTGLPSSSCLSLVSF